MPLDKAKGDAEMTNSPATLLFNVDLQPGKPPVLQAEASGDAARWATEHRDALRAFVTEHGSLLVRGLGLRDAAQTEAIFRQLGSLTTEREAFASRRADGRGRDPGGRLAKRPQSVAGRLGRAL